MKRFISLFFGCACCVTASGNEMDTMKATMDNMKQEMEVMRSTMASECDAMRANAGGAPEALKSASGKATVKIGGELKLRYTASIQNGYQNAATQYDNSRYTRTRWDIYKADLNFKIDFTPDTCGYISLRPDRGSASVGNLLDEAWWKWRSIGGTGFSAKVGLQDLDFGMFNADASPWERVMISEPYVKTTATTAVSSYPTALDHERDITAIGMSAGYEWDQFKVVAGVYGQRSSNDDGMDNTLGVTSDGTARNLDIENHYVTGKYDPCWLEGLHLQASYLGEFDQGQGAGTFTSTPTSTIYTASAATWYPGNFDARTLRGATYVPAFDFGVSYTADKWAVYAEGIVIANPQFYKDSVVMTYTIGADYALTERLKLGGMFDWESIDLSHYYGNLRNYRNVYGDNGRVEVYSLRAALAAKYDFGNGLYVQAQYSHSWNKAWGVADNKCKDADAINLQTGFKF